MARRLPALLMQHRVVALEKSRRMMVSLLTGAWCLFDMIRNPGGLWAIQSAGYDLSLDMLTNKLLPMLTYMEGNPFNLTWRTTQRPCKLRINRKGELVSECLAVPQGEKAVVGRTLSGYIGDEVARQREFSEAWSSAGPALMSPDGIGWALLISTPRGYEEFHRMIYGGHAA